MFRIYNVFIIVYDKNICIVYLIIRKYYIYLNYIFISILIIE